MEDRIQLAFSWLCHCPIFAISSPGCTSILRYPDHDDHSHNLHDILLVNSVDGIILIGFISKR